MKLSNILLLTLLVLSVTNLANCSWEACTSNTECAALAKEKGIDGRRAYVCKYTHDGPFMTCQKGKKKKKRFESNILLKES